jgi:hypothetical protein
MAVCNEFIQSETHSRFLAVAVKIRNFSFGKPKLHFSASSEWDEKIISKTEVKTIAEHVETTE